MKVAFLKRWLPLAALTLLAFAAACSRTDVPPVVVQVFVTATHIVTPEPSRTPVPTATPTPTPTPTATALPVTVRGNPRAQGLQGPTPVAGAYCGLVDTLDFPLEPPDAVGIRGGQDYGVYRQRYEKNHAGEDWGIRGGSLGEPVYAIGHGVVTYADGLGWGRDKGVIIVRHTFQDGGTILSFYGHLDPPSVTLQPGACVRRGQHIADIGNPSSSPHLHFEIRSHMPHVPGPGYWPDDPTLVGWQPPSRYIWDYRAARTPGVRWTRFDLDAMRPVGAVDAETFVALEGSRLAGLYLPGGGLRWAFDLGFRPADAVLSTDASLVFTIKGFGLLEAWRLPGPEKTLSPGVELEPEWQLDLEGVRLPRLAPLPGGGVAVFSPDRQMGVSASGDQRWEAAHPGSLEDWHLEGATLLAAVGEEDGSILSLDEAGAAVLADGLSGQLAADGERVFVLGASGLYLLERDTGERRELLSLAEASGAGQILLIPGEGVYALHRDSRDRLLIALDMDGELRWVRSVRQLSGEAYGLLGWGGRAYFMVQARSTYAGDLSLFELDPSTPVLRLVFVGGSRDPDPRAAWIAPAGPGVLLQIGGGSLVLFDPSAPPPASGQ